MSEYTIYIVFDMQSNERLSRLSYILEFVKSSADHGFGFYNDYHKRDVLETESALEFVEKDRNSAVDNLKVFHGLNFLTNSLDVSIGFDIRNFNLFAVTVSSRSFSRDKKERLKTTRDLVRFCEIAYNTFSPDYGYGLTSPEIQPIESSNLHSVPDTVFDLNFFGPKLVKKIGKENLSICPTWRTVEFDDGGVLLELSEDPVEAPGEFRDKYIETANILGVSKTQIGM